MLAKITSKNQITIRHLLNHRSGLTYQWNPKLGKCYYDAGVTHGMIQDSGTIGENMKKLAKICLELLLIIL